MYVETTREDHNGAANLGQTTFDQRAYPRFPVDLTGVCSVAGGSDLACKTLNLSIGGIAFLCNADVDLYVEVLASLPQIGLVRGTVVRTFVGGFAMAFVETRVQRERVTNFLVWLIERAANPDTEDRGHDRIVPLRRMVSIAIVGSTSMARIIDVSRSGVAVTASAQVIVGDCVLLGRTPAAVARLFRGGFAAQFLDPLAPDFNASVIL